MTYSLAMERLLYKSTIAQRLKIKNVKDLG